MLLARIPDCRITDYIGFNVVGKRRITECGVGLVALATVRDSIGISKSSSADNGLRGYGFMRLAGWVRISCGYVLRDYGYYGLF